MTNLPRTIYTVVFCVLFSFLKDISFFSGINKILVSAILGAIGAGFGVLIYQLVEKRNNTVKYIVLGGLALLLITISVLLNFKSEKNKLDKQIETYFDSTVESKIKELTNNPIDTNALKPPKLSAVESAKLVTCEVCGYKAVCPDSTHCYNCFSSTFDLSVYKPSEKTNWLKNQQEFWFYPDEKTGRVNFFEPKVENGLKKDPLWKPIVTEKEVKEYHKDDKLK